MQRRSILFAVIATMALWQAAAALGSFSFSDASGLDGSAFYSAGSDDDKLENIIEEAMQKIGSLKLKSIDRAAEAEVQAKASSSIPQNNSTLQNMTGQNLTAIDRGTLSGSTGGNGGVYSMSASRHEMGKSDIESKMLLRGTFEAENSIKFQDQGF